MVLNLTLSKLLWVSEAILARASVRKIFLLFLLSLIVVQLLAVKLRKQAERNPLVRRVVLNKEGAGTSGEQYCKEGAR